MVTMAGLLNDQTLTPAPIHAASADTSFGDIYNLSASSFFICKGKVVPVL